MGAISSSVGIVFRSFTAPSTLRNTLMVVTTSSIFSCSVVEYEGSSIDSNWCVLFTTACTSSTDMFGILSNSTRASTAACTCARRSWMVPRIVFSLLTISETSPNIRPKGIALASYWNESNENDVSGAWLLKISSMLFMLPFHMDTALVWATL